MCAWNQNTQIHTQKKNNQNKDTQQIDHWTRKWKTTNKSQNIDALVKNNELLQQRASGLLSQNDQTAEESTNFFLQASISWVVIFVCDWFEFFVPQFVTFTGFSWFCLILFWSVEMIRRCNVSNRSKIWSQNSTIWARKMKGNKLKSQLSWQLFLEAMTMKQWANVRNRSLTHYQKVWDLALIKLNLLKRCGNHNHSSSQWRSCHFQQTLMMKFARTSNFWEMLLLQLKKQSKIKNQPHLTTAK